MFLVCLFRGVVVSSIVWLVLFVTNRVVVLCWFLCVLEWILELTRRSFRLGLLLKAEMICMFLRVGSFCWMSVNVFLIWLCRCRFWVEKVFINGITFLFSPAVFGVFCVVLFFVFFSIDLV